MTSVPEENGSLLVSAVRPNKWVTTITGSLVNSERAQADHLFTRRLETLFQPDHVPLENVSHFIAMLDTLSVPGPLAIVDPLNLDHFLGEGAQFAVYRNSMLDSGNCETHAYLHPVAVKKCRFTLQDNQPLDLSSRDFRSQVHNMRLEVAALQDARLQQHRNIVNLLGWGTENNWHETPFLVLELAIGDLQKFLKSKTDGLGWDIRQQLVLGIGSGLDAIHHCGIIHGDLKPLNVLVFQHDIGGVPFIAKLADFGLSANEVEANTNDLVEISGISIGWCAPEISANYRRSKVSTAVMIKADNYSYGLLALSCMCLDGAAPFSETTSTVEEILDTATGMPVLLRSTLETALSLLLQNEGASRPFLVQDLFKDSSIGCQSWTRDNDDYENYLALNRTSSPFAHAWTLPSLAAFLFQGLEKSYRRYHVTMNGQHLFAMFLLRSFHEVSYVDKSLQVDMLLEAADKGYVPAQGVAGIVLNSYERADYRVTPSILTQWLYNAASTGSVLAAAELAISAPILHQKARDAFHRALGYNQFYSPMTAVSVIWSNESTLHSEASNTAYQDADGNGALHYLAAHGNLPGVTAFLKLENVDINATNFRGETALCKACLAGCWTTAAELCRHGADASIGETPNNVTCLHWLFNFPTSHIGEAATALVERGADPNALLSRSRSISVVNYHFPFSWPPGSPLHWAVASSNVEAVAALLLIGSDPCLRNGCDPYIADENVRALHCHGTAEEGEFSEAPGQCLGLNAIDLAAARHDWKTLECIKVNCQDRNLFEADEEGYTPFHRLEHLRVGRARDGLRFWHAAFEGNASTREDNILRTIRTLQAAGGNINQMTSSGHKSSRPNVTGLTPLMLAVTKSDAESVSALLKCGADPNIINRSGCSALSLIPEDAAGLSPPGSARAIARCLLDHNAEVNPRSRNVITPLLNAINSLLMDVIKLVIENGADATATYHGCNILAILVTYCDHRTSLAPPALSIAESQSRENEIVAILQQAILEPARNFTGGPSLIVDRDDGTFLHYAAQAGLPTLVSALLAADPDLVNIIRQPDPYMPRPPPSTYKARHIYTGTALDVVDAEISFFTHRRSGHLSQDGVDFIAGKLHAVRKILLENHATTRLSCET